MKLSVTFRARWDLLHIMVRSSEVAKLVPPCSTLRDFLVRLLEVAIVIERQMIQGHQDPIRIIGIFPKGLGGPVGDSGRWGAALRDASSGCRLYTGDAFHAERNSAKKNTNHLRPKTGMLPFKFCIEI
jgi:hypothetical protein